MISKKKGPSLLVISKFLRSLFVWRRLTYATGDGSRWGAHVFSPTMLDGKV